MLKLMIVDDEPIILAGIKDMVEKGNTAFTMIKTAGDGEEALDMMDYFQPDLVITDIQMPEMDGLEFIRKAKTKNVERFIILSGYDIFEYAQRAIRLQVAEYLLKPINETQLVELLKRMAIDILDQRRLEGATASKTTGEGTLSEHVKLLKDYLHTFYMKDISLSDAAEYLGLHPAYIGQLFKRETGDTFVHYINGLRMGKAKELLLSGESLPLDKIAGLVGFENPRTFYKVFRKYTGQTPGEYRESHFEKGERL
ncbi:response regulator [Cohnella sp. CFH 77786]|uniref:response regulator n=1 Tax=Cohnella sp. CFH 77786 TaxID=2662265 RepID=UPI001C60ED34|nr:response regulator [Cohnella sp. CFH 77786]MBW5446462.1 response regulator [Cohnella sp. CFH 77786]